MMNEEIDFEEYAPWLVILITLVGSFLRVLQLGLKGMWLDETFSVWMAGHSVADMLAWIVRIDQHPPLSYMLLHDHTLIWTTIPLYLVLAAGVVQVKFRPLMILVVGILGTINLFSAGEYFRFYQKED